MSRLLQRLGGASARRPWTVVVIWLLVLLSVSGAAAAFKAPFSTEFKIPGTQFQQVLDDLRHTFPSAAGGHSSVIVRNPDGRLTDVQKKQISATVKTWTEADGVRTATDPFLADAAMKGRLPQMQPRNAQEAAYLKRFQATLGDTKFVSADGSTALVSISFEEDMPNVPLEQRQHLQELGRTLSDQGLQVEYSKEITQNIDSIIGPGEVVGVLLAGVILLVMLGSLLAAGMPLVLALVGVGVGVGGTLALGQVVELQSISPALALMLGLAVGIDYALFILNRHRIQLLQGVEAKASIAHATGTAGNSVVFAGLTVIVALAALVVTGIPFLAVIGFAAAATVAIAVLVAITLSPALMAILGHRVLPARAWKRHGFTAQGEPVPGAAHLTEAEEDEAVLKPHGSAGWARLATRAPWLTILAALALLGTLAVPAFSMRLGLPDGGAEPKGSTAHRAYELTAEKFGAGQNGPLVAVGTMPEGQNQQTARILQLATAEKIKAMPGVAAVVPVTLTGVSEDNRTLAWQVVPKEGPAAESTVDLVHTLRDQRGDLRKQTGVDVQITGQTVANIDISQKLADALPLYLALVVGLSLLVLLLVFRSILVPLIATGGFLLSLAAALGAVVAVYQWGWLGDLLGVTQPEALLSFLPTLLIGVLFGLAMDYQVFLVSGMREAYHHGRSAREAVLVGFAHSRRVVTAAALIMGSVFAGFVHAELTMIRPLGFGLAVGVLLDAFVIRMTLTPALLHLLGEKAWWLPRWLDRLLPNVDVEGAALDRPATR